MNDTPDDTPDEDATTPAGAPDDTPDEVTDKDAEIEKWKALARKHEGRAKENSKAQKELDELRKQSMSDQEKAVEEARDAGRQEATASLAQKLAAAELRAALTGLVENPSEIVEDLNLAKFVGDDGEVDTDKVNALKEKYADLKPDTGNAGRTRDLGQGRNRGQASDAKPSVSSGRDLYQERHAKK